jgi:membrane protein implicated in regulation of membrane protease activity
VTDVYWVCLVGGAAVAALVFLFGDVLQAAFDGIGDHAALDPLALLGGVTAFGGAGLLLDAYTGLPPGATALVAGALALLLAVATHLGYVRPMRRAENSTAFSHREYAGRLGEVSTPVPARGFGEVLVRMGASTTFQAAASADGRPIARGARVVVVEVEPDGSLVVAPFEEGEERSEDRGWRMEERGPRTRGRLRS